MKKKKLKLKLIFCRSRRMIKKMSDSIFAAKRSAIQASFEEKANNCLENIVEFSSLIKHIHDISGCGENCEVGYFSNELYRYFDYKNFFLYLCKKYSTGFHDNFLIATSKDFALDYFTKEKNGLLSRNGSND